MKRRFAPMTFICAALALSSGCEPKTDLHDGPDALADASVPSAAALIGIHNARLAHLGTFHGRGVVQLEWVDTDGRRRREPQVDIEVWIDQPNHTAFRFDKFGEVYLWAGSDDDQYWLFDLTGEPRQLTTGRHDESIRLEGNAVFSIRPRSLLDLLALAPLDESDDSGVVWRDGDRNAWVLELPSPPGTSRPPTQLRYYYSGAVLRPIRAELLDDAGQIILEASLERYESALLADRSIDPPLVAEIMRIRDGAGEASMQIFLDEVTDGKVDDQPFERLFDLNRLRRALRPEVINGEPAEGAAG